MPDAQIQVGGVSILGISDATVKRAAAGGRIPSSTGATGTRSFDAEAVAEAVVIGVPDSYRGQAPLAFVTLRSGQSSTGDELRDFLRDKLSPIELPARVEIRTTLPKTVIGKLSRKETDALAEWSKGFGAKGLAVTKVSGSGLDTGVAKFLQPIAATRWKASRDSGNFFSAK